MKRILASIALVGSIFAAGLLTSAPAQAQAQAHRAPCPYYGICEYEGINLTGNDRFLPDSTIPNGTVFNMLNANGLRPQSVRNHSDDGTHGGDLWVHSRTLNTYGCIVPGDQTNTGGIYGYGELVRTANNNCSENHPNNMG